MKRCANCGEDKPRSEFYPRYGTSVQRLQSWCKQCVGIAQRAPHHAARRRERHLELVRRLAELKAHPCVDCDVQYPPPVMEFDHVRGTKKFPISAANLARKDLVEELAKCELRCANCHRMRHYC